MKLKIDNISVLLNVTLLVSSLGFSENIKILMSYFRLGILNCRKKYRKAGYIRPLYMLSASLVRLSSFNFLSLHFLEKSSENFE